MIERFLEILRYSFENYQDSLVLNSAKFQNPNLSLEVSLHFDDEKMITLRNMAFGDLRAQKYESKN